LLNPQNNWPTGSDLYMCRCVCILWC